MRCRKFPDRKSIRLPHHDYSQCAYYFVTICTLGQRHLFGEIVDGKSVLNDYGVIIKKCFSLIEQQFEHIRIDPFVIMPNHVHFIIHIMPNPLMHVGAPFTGALYQITGAPYPNTGAPYQITGAPYPNTGAL